jgi:hypothetical protein
MLVYSLNAAFEDVSLVVARSGEALDYDRRRRAAGLLHTLVRAGRVAGLPDDPELWPAGHPAAWVVGTMCHAGPAQPIDGGDTPAESSPWALREAANEMRIGLSSTADALDGLPEDERAEEEAECEHAHREIDELLQHADHIEGEHSELPAPDELAGYDAENCSPGDGDQPPHCGSSYGDGWVSGVDVPPVRGRRISAASESSAGHLPVMASHAARRDTFSAMTT